MFRCVVFVFAGNVALGIDAYTEAIRCDPSLLRAVTNRAFYRQGMCAWGPGLEADIERVRAAVAEGGAQLDGVQAFQALMFPLRPCMRCVAV